MIDPGHGFAPPEWQGGVGDCLVARADKQPLDTKTLAAITGYVSEIPDAFGDERDAGEIARSYYRRDQLDRFIAKHMKTQDAYQSFLKTS